MMNNGTEFFHQQPFRYITDHHSPELKYPIRYKRIVEDISDTIWEIDTDGVFTYIFHQEKDVLGYDSTELIGKSILSLIADGEASRFSETLQACIELKNAIIRLEVTAIHKDGRKIILENSAIPVYDSHEQFVGFHGMSKDVTEKNQILNDLQARNAEVEQLLEQKKEFIQLLSHDLKNPLMVLSNLLKVMDPSITEQKFREMRQICIRNINSMKELIRETVDLAQLDHVDNEMKKQRIRLKQKIDHIIDDHQIFFGEHGVLIQNSIDENTVVYGNDYFISELIFNLLTNAVKYTPDTSPCRIIVNADQYRDQIKVSIADNGIGLTEKQKTQIFDKFNTFCKPRKGMSSTGLGLSLCRSIVEKHDGMIWVESEGLGNGSTFCFTLPTGDHQIV